MVELTHQDTTEAKWFQWILAAKEIKEKATYGAIPRKFVKGIELEETRQGLMLQPPVR